LRLRILCNPSSYAKLLINFTFLGFLTISVIMFVICLQTSRWVDIFNTIGA
jgi:hypothetical protein